jgi:hypothetical protein
MSTIGLLHLTKVLRRRPKTGKRCNATTKSGKRCRRSCIHLQTRCLSHTPKNTDIQKLNTDVEKLNDDDSFNVHYNTIIKLPPMLPYPSPIVVHRPFNNTPIITDSPLSSNAPSRSIDVEPPSDNFDDYIDYDQHKYNVVDFDSFYFVNDVGDFPYY